MVRKWLQLTRAHSAPLETVPALLGAALASGSLYNPLVLGWGLFGLLYHLAGYGHNSVSDFRRGHDKDDPNKQHHPLNKPGVVFKVAAPLVAVGLILATVAWGLWMVLVSPAPDVRMAAAVSILAFGIISGVIYNIFSKQTNLKFIPIAIAHTSVFVVPYVAMGGSINILFALLSVYVFLWVVYQIAISGEMKDIGVDDANLLLDMGAEYLDDHDYIRSSMKIKSVAVLLRLAVIIVAGVASRIVGANLFTMGMVVGLLLLALIESDHVVKTDYYERDKRVRSMSIIEALTMSAMCITLSPVLGFINMMCLILISASWVIIFNYMEWGTTLTPKV